MVPVTAFYFGLFTLVLSGSALASTCGPESCGLTCAEDESCLQDLEVRQYWSGHCLDLSHCLAQISCCCEPCCPQWSCDQHSTCPQHRPDLGSPCSSQGQHCDYGSQECCGQTYPEISMQCDGGTWQGYYVDTLCVLGNYKLDKVWSRKISKKYHQLY